MKRKTYKLILTLILEFIVLILMVICAVFACIVVSNGYILTTVLVLLLSLKIAHIRYLNDKYL